MTPSILSKMKAASHSLFHTDLQANFMAWLPNLFETMCHSPIDDRGKTNSRNEPVRLKNIRLGTQVPNIMLSYPIQLRHLLVRNIPP